MKMNKKIKPKTEQRIELNQKYGLRQRTGQKRAKVGDSRAEDTFDPYEIIFYPLSTEKSIRQIEFDNKLIFAVNSRATKADVKKAVEQMFKVKVVSVNIQNSFQGGKRAYVKLSPENLASDISADLGLI